MIKATLIDSMGDDLRVANAARVSFDKESDWLQEPMDDKGWFDDKFLSDRDTKLIQYLARNGHWTPFSHPQITLREDVPIFVARQRFKHMVGFTYNEVSRRYVDSDPKFYHPGSWRKAAENVKQGSSDETVEFVKDYHKDLCERALRHYKHMLACGVAPEQARMVLPQSMMTSYYTTGSLAAFARAYKQRSDSHSQKEIRDLAVQWDQIIRPLFPVSWAALTA